MSRHYCTVSIHAPTGGATAKRSRFFSHCPFQFTRPRGARLGVDLAQVGDLVSIHAPTGGATEGGFVHTFADGFNSRAHGGRDPKTT